MSPLHRHADDGISIFNVHALSKLPTLAGCEHHLESCDNDGYCNACGEQTILRDLKVETAHERTWLSRCDRTDGMCCNAHVTLERCVDGKWITVYEECHD